MATGGGVWAPTIRHRDGVFYVIVTIAMTPRGCVVFTVDPNLAWDEDGTAYVTFSGLHLRRRADDGWLGQGGEEGCAGAA